MFDVDKVSATYAYLNEFNQFSDAFKKFRDEFSGTRVFKINQYGYLGLSHEAKLIYFDLVIKNHPDLASKAKDLKDWYEELIQDPQIGFKPMPIDHHDWIIATLQSDSIEAGRIVWKENEDDEVREFITQDDVKYMYNTTVVQPMTNENYDELRDMWTRGWSQNVWINPKSMFYHSVMQKHDSEYVA